MHVALCVADPRAPLLVAQHALAGAGIRIRICIRLFQMRSGSTSLWLLFLGRR